MHLSFNRKRYEKLETDEPLIKEFINPLDEENRSTSKDMSTSEDMSTSVTGHALKKNIFRKRRNAISIIEPRKTNKQQEVMDTHLLNNYFEYLNSSTMENIRNIEDILSTFKKKSKV